MRRASSSAHSARAVGAIYAAGERVASRDARNSAMAGARPVGPRAADIRCRSVKGKLCSGKTRSRVGRRVENWVPVSLGSAARGPSYGLHPLGVAKPGLRLRPCRPVQALASRFWWDRCAQDLVYPPSTPRYSVWPAISVSTLSPGVWSAMAARRTKSRLWQASRWISRREIGRIGIQIGRRSSWPSSLCGFGRRKASCVPRAEDSAAAGHRSFTPTCGRSWAQLAPQPSAISGRERERPKAGPSRRLAVLNRENRTPVFGPRPQRDRGQWSAHLAQSRLLSRSRHHAVGCRAARAEKMAAEAKGVLAACRPAAGLRHITRDARRSGGRSGHPPRRRHWHLASPRRLAPHRAANAWNRQFTIPSGMVSRCERRGINQWKSYEKTFWLLSSPTLSSSSAYTRRRPNKPRRRCRQRKS